MNYSRQRDLILNYLRNTKSHPTAEEIYQQVKNDSPEISLGTVYRNLNQLSGRGIILKLHMKDGKDHFDADTGEHYHFYCEKCGRVSDLNTKLPVSAEKLCKTADKSSKCRIEECMIIFMGICDKCLE